ncbi:MAG: C4-dicarboxylate TRAP transporter substrate-binding protein [Alphaproteobacteria bacterium]|nr:C4-dicarboxylate TRAP transporter substrate-binding protein [Alphaproteobacteria bacterium]
MRSFKTLTFGVATAAMVAVSAPQAGAAEFKLTAGSSHPPIIPWVGTIKNHVVPQSVARLKAMGGKHTIKWTEAYAGALYNWKNTLEGIQDGLADVGWVGTLWEPSKLPLHNASFYAPFATTNIVHLQQIQDEMHRTMPIMRQRWRKYNQVYLGSQAIDGYVLVSKTPIRSVADLKGKKFYAPGASGRWLDGTGAVGVNGALTVYYNGIKSGVTDGAILPGSAVLPFKIYEVAPHLLEPNVGAMITGALTMNLNTWNKLPADMKKMFAQLGQEYGELVAKRVKANRIKHFGIMAKKGAKITVLPLAEQQKWAKALPNLAGQWTKQIEAKGLPAKAVLKTYLDGVRKRGNKPIRAWDKEL